METFISILPENFRRILAFLPYRDLIHTLQATPDYASLIRNPEFWAELLEIHGVPVTGDETLFKLQWLYRRATNSNGGTLGYWNGKELRYFDIPDIIEAKMYYRGGQEVVVLTRTELYEIDSDFTMTKWPLTNLPPNRQYKVKFDGAGQPHLPERTRLPIGEVVLDDNQLLYTSGSKYQVLATNVRTYRVVPNHILIHHFSGELEVWLVNRNGSMPGQIVAGIPEVRSFQFLRYSNDSETKNSYLVVVLVNDQVVTYSLVTGQMVDPPVSLPGQVLDLDLIDVNIWFTVYNRYQEREFDSSHPEIRPNYLRVDGQLISDVLPPELIQQLMTKYLIDGLYHNDVDDPNLLLSLTSIS